VIEHSRAPGSAAFALFALLSLFGFSSAARAQDCDRACLGGLMTQFIAALVAHDPSGLPLADNVRYTEDSRNARLGEGIWQSVTAIPKACAWAISRTAARPSPPKLIAWKTA
jgi:hypothetical protein